jgi:hypothetical protein
MKYPIFEKTILLLQKNHSAVHQAYRLGIDITEVTDPMHEVVSLLYGSHYGQEGLDWIDWWCCEKDFGSNEKINAFDKDGNEICKNVYELWEIVEDCKESRHSFDMKHPMSDEERKNIIESFFKSI